jgi:hypothetical protein
VVFAVELDDQFRFYANKISDVLADHVLASEFVAAEFAIPD